MITIQDDRPRVVPLCYRLVPCGEKPGLSQRTNTRYVQVLTRLKRSTRLFTLNRFPSRGRWIFIVIMPMKQTWSSSPPSLTFDKLLLFTFNRDSSVLLIKIRKHRTPWKTSHFLLSSIYTYIEGGDLYQLCKIFGRFKQLLVSTSAHTWFTCLSRTRFNCYAIWVKFCTMSRKVLA